MMIIDVSEKIETAKRLTKEWADRAGYKAPPEEAETISKKARDLQRIMNVSSFGCQQRNVHKLLEVLIGETFPIRDGVAMVDYSQREPFVVGSVLVPLRHGFERAGIVTRVSQSGNAGLKLSNGELHPQHFAQDNVRPATDEEIDHYFAEWFGERVNALDEPSMEMVLGEPDF